MVSRRSAKSPYAGSSPVPTSNKFRAQKTTVDSITFASKKEAGYYAMLKYRKMAGEITDIEIQPKFPLIIDGVPVKQRSAGYPNGRAITYIADFGFMENGVRHIVDVKGMDTRVSALKRAIVEVIYKITIEVV